MRVTSGYNGARNRMRNDNFLNDSRANIVMENIILIYFSSLNKSKMKSNWSLINCR